MLTIQCRLVHSAQDQCAYVHANCEDEDAGLLSYLQLFYCTMPHAKPAAFMIIIVWLGLLFSTIGIAASDFFCVNLSTISTILGMTESMAGVTFLAFGNGSPDVFSTFAAMKTHSGSLAVGELIGAAGFITAVVAGSMALVRPFKVARKSFIRDVGFFIVAASFSMVFLADGRLHMWECAVMVGFYVFYVITVVLWHWYLKKLSRRKALEDAARNHFHIPSTDEAAVEPYHDEESEGIGRASRSPSRTVSGDGFVDLERAGDPALRFMEEEIDADGETRDQYLAEIRNNMRVSRPKRGERRNTTNPIRPSLVGALEFRAVLSSLQKSKNIPDPPVSLRRYSDDPAFLLSQHNSISRRASNPNIRYEDTNARDAARNLFHGRGAEATTTGPTRARAVSTNDVTDLRRDSRPLEVPQIDFTDTTITSAGGAGQESPKADPRSGGLSIDSLPSPAVTLSSSQGEYGYMASSPMPMTPQERHGSADLLAPPDGYRPNLPGRYQSRLEAHHHGSGPSRPSGDNVLKPAVPKLRIPGTVDSPQISSPISPFPEYEDDDPNHVHPQSSASNIRVASPSIGPESSFDRCYFHEPQTETIDWWPYKVLPAPQVLISTLLPTIHSWHDKGFWEKMLAIVAAPSVFLLTVTLPIVEADKDEDGDAVVDPGLLAAGKDLPRSGSTLVPLPSDDPNQLLPTAFDNGPQNSQKHENHGIGSPSINITAPVDGSTNHPPLPATKSSPQPSLPRPHTPSPTPTEWNRWLVATQTFTAPLFILLLVYANLDPSNPKRFFFPLLYTLIGCLVVFAALLLLTTSDRPPKYRYLLCFVGFVVAIAWISTIAGEVVAVLKALGIILNMSDAILGLTIFAVGNSLGDLVADITVARLGYPVMALSACFGGPMLNILLGIGISGLYVTIHGGQHRHHRHPDKPIKYKPFHIEIGRTLLISGITLLVTLLALLILVPLRGWWMDRKIGCGLIILWTLSTLGNVVVEGVGWGGDIS